MTTGKISQLYSDKEHNNPIFPKTSMKCVSDDNGNTLDTMIPKALYKKYLSGDTVQLYSDSGCIQPVYAKTYTKSVYDDNGTNQDQLNKLQEQWNNDQLKENKRIGITGYYTATLMLNGWSNIYKMATMSGKWRFDKYTSVAQSNGILDTLNTMTPVETKYYDDSGINIIMDIGNNYTAKCTISVYSSNDKLVTISFTTDDDGTVYLNNEYVDSLSSCSKKDIALNLKQGWNEIVVSYTEGSGGDGWTTTPHLASFFDEIGYRYPEVVGFQQTVPCKDITTDMNDNFDQPKTEYSSDADTYIALQEGLQALCTPGYTVIAGNGEITWSTPKKPAIDIPVYLSRIEVK